MRLKQSKNRTHNIRDVVVLCLQLLQALHRVGLHATIVVAPAVQGRLAYAESPGDLGDRSPCGQFGIRLAQLADDLLWSVPLLQLRESSFYPSGAVGLS